MSQWSWMTPNNGKIGLVHSTVCLVVMWTDYMSHLVTQPLCTCFVALYRRVPVPCALALVVV
jgi:hypothetical protein